MEAPVTFRVGGTQVFGILHAAENARGPSPAVLFLHGFTGTKVEPHRIFVKAARALAREGFTALRFDFRGWGDSGGESEESSISTMVEDARAATDFLLAHQDVDATRLGYVGMSTGGAVAALASAQDPRVKSVALWNAVADGGEIVKRLGTAVRMNSLAQTSRADYNGNWIGQRFVTEFAVMRPAEALASRAVSTLLIHASQDEQVSPSQVEIYHQAMRKTPGRCQKVVLADADHTFSSTVWEKEVIERTVKWFEQAM